MEKMTEKEALLQCIYSELYEIKCHLANDRQFEGGVGLGGLMSLVANGQYQEQEARKREQGEKNAKVQEEEVDEECEEGSEEEDSTEHSYFLECQREKAARIETENALLESEKKVKKLEETNVSINETKRCIMELQDIVMRLLKFKKIAKEEIDNVISILINTGVEKGDIDVICKGKIR